MTELERELRSYAVGLALPETAEVWPAVAARLQARPRPRRRLLPIAVAVALAATAAVAVAVGPARSAILDLLGFDGVEVVRIDQLPAVDRLRPIDLGVPGTLAEAKAAVPFQLLAVADRRPSAVYIGRDRPPAISFVYGSLLRPRLVLSEFRPCCGRDWLTKEVTPDVHVTRLELDDGPAVWIAGRHAASGDGSVRIAGPTLLWRRNRVIYRIESQISENEALALARALVPATP